MRSPCEEQADSPPAGSAQPLLVAPSLLQQDQSDTMRELWVLSGLGHASLWMRDAFKHYSLEFSAVGGTMAECSHASRHSKHGCF